MLAVFGTVADHALLDQARLAGEAALSEAGEKARLMAASVRAAIAEVDQNVPGPARSRSEWLRQSHGRKPCAVVHSLICPQTSKMAHE